MNPESKVASLLDARELVEKYDSLIAKRDFADAMLRDANIKIRMGSGSIIVEQFKREKSSLGHGKLIGEWNTLFEKAVAIWREEVAFIESEIKALEELK